MNMRRQSTTETASVGGPLSVATTRRPSDRATRYFTADAIETARRQRQFECLVLSQVYSRAQRIRERSRAEGKTPLGRRLDEEEGGAEQWSDAAPITLIELIQASGAVFEKHAIAPPTDAVFHRYLLTLSMDPETDWKKKIQRFSITQQPRAKRQSVTTATTPRLGMPSTSKSAQRASITSVQTNAQRRNSVISQASIATQLSRKPSIQSQRRASIVSKRDSIVSTKALSVKHAVGNDLFGDTLATSLPWKLKENQIRNAAIAEVQAATGRTRSSASSVASPPKRSASSDELSDENDVTVNLTLKPHQEEEDMDDDALDVSIPSPSLSSPIEPWRVVHPVTDAGSTIDSPVVHLRAPRSKLPATAFQFLAMVFQQWKEITKFQRLVHDSRQRELRLTQSILPPIATFAVFKWMAIALPPQPERAGSATTNRAIPTFVLSRGLVQSEAKLTLLFTGRMLVWVIHRIFRVWKQETKRTKAFRIKTMVRRRTELLHAVYTCLHRWRSHTRYRRQTKHHSVWVEALRSRHCLRDAMRTWRAAFKIQLQVAGARATSCRRTMKSFFTAWNARTRLKIKCTAIGNKRKTRRAMDMWRRLIQAQQLKKQSIDKAIRFHRRHCLVQYWHAWSSHSRSHRVLRLAISGMSTRREIDRKHRVFAMWKAECEVNRHYHQRYQRFVRRRRLRLLRSTVDAWATHARCRRHWALVLLDRSADRELRLLHRVVRAWVDHFSAITEADDRRVLLWESLRRRVLWSHWKAQSKVLRVCRALVSMNTNGIVKTVWVTWKNRVARSNYYRALVVGNLMEKEERLKRSVFQALAMNLQRGQSLHQEVKEFTERQDGVRLQIYLWEWLEISRDRRAKHQEDMDTIQRWRHQRLSGLWSQWRQAIHINQCVRVADTALASTRKQRCFHSLKLHLHRQQEQRRRQEELTGVRLRAAVGKWTRRVSTTKRIHRLRTDTLKLSSTYLLSRGWRVWREQFEASVQQNASISKALDVWQHRYVAQYFHRWVYVYRDRKRWRVVLATWTKNGRTKAVTKSWSNWCQYVSHRRQRKQMAVDALRHRDRSILQISMRVWKACSRLYRARLEALQRCLDQWTQSRRLEVFTKWQQFVIQRRKAKQLAFRVMGSQRRICFVQWKNWLGTRQTTASRFTLAVSQLETWKLRRGIKRLHLHAGLAKRLNMIRTVMETAGARGLLAASFAGWVAVVSKSRSTQASVAHATARLQMYRQQRSIQRWSSFTRVKKLITTTMLRVQARSTVSLQHHILKKWRAFVSQQKLFQALKEKATVFRVFCLLPTTFHAWRRFVGDQQHKRTLVEKAARLMSHHREARAFKAWVDATVLFKHTKLALRTWQNQAVSSCYARWKAFHQLMRHRRQADAYYRHASRRKVIMAWRKEARRHRLLRHFSALWNSQTTQQSFRQWARHTKLKKHARAMLQRLQNCSVSRVFNSWKQLIWCQVDEATRIQQRFGLLWNHDRKMTTFQRWKAFAALQRRMKVHILKHLQDTTANCFSQWRQWLTYRQRTRRHGDSVLRESSRRLVESSWVVWRSQAATLVAVAVLQRHALRCSMDGTLQVILREWRRVTTKLLRAKSLTRTLNERALRRIVSSWHEFYVLRRRRENQQGVAVHRAHEALLMRRVLRRMRGRVLLKRACVKALLPQIQRDNVSTAWMRWLLHHSHKQATKMKVLTVKQSIESSQRPATSGYCMRRWRLLHAARAFHRWTQVASRQAWIRSRTVNALGKWQGTQSRRFFHEWRQWTASRKHQRRVDTSERHHLQRRAWKRWLDFHRYQRRVLSLMHKAIGFSDRSTRSFFFTAWRRFHSRLRHYQLVQAAVAIRRLHRLVREWQCIAAAKRARRLQLTLAQVAYDHKTKLNCWGQWLGFVGQVRCHRLELQQHTERLQVLTMCSVFRAWHAWSHRQRKIAAILSTISGCCHSKTVRSVLFAWCSYARVKRFHREAADRFRYKTHLSKGVKALRVCALTQQRHRRSVDRAKAWMEVLQSRHLAGRWRQWKAYTAYRRKTRLARTRYSSGFLLPFVWRGWRSHVLDSKKKRKKLASALSCWRLQSTRKAWHALTFYRHHCLSKRHAALKADTHYVHRWISTVLSQWRATATRVRKLRATGGHLLVRWRLQAVYKCFANWQQYSLHRKAQRVTGLIVSTRRVTEQLYRAWREWRRLFVVAHVGKRRRLQRSWAKLALHTGQRKAWRAFQLQQQRTLMETVRVRRGIRQWRHYVVETKLGKTMALLSSRFSRDTLARRFFERWLAFLVVRVKEKETMRRTLVWIRNRSLLRCFRGLRLYVEAQHNRKRLRVKAEVYYTQRLVSTTFHGWRQRTATAKRQRQILRSYLETMQRVAQRRSFSAWSEYVTRRRELRLRFATVLAQRTRVATGTIFQAWQRYVEKTKRVKAAQDHYVTRRYCEAFCHWRRFVVLARMERMLGASAQRLLEKCLVEWRKRAATSKRARAMREAVTQRKNHEILGEIVAAWRAWSQLQSKCNKLLVHVAVGNHRRFRFWLWKTYTAQRIRLKRLVTVQETERPSVLENEAATLEDASEDKPPTQPPAADQLARMARTLHRFDVAWGDLRASWQRWRHAFHARLFYRMRRLYRCFAAWQSWSQRRRQRNRLVAGRRSSHRRAMTRRVLLAWRGVVVLVKQIQRERRRERELQVIVSTEIQRQERKAIQKHWAAWRALTEDKRYLLVSVNSYWRARVLTKFWLLWAHDFVKVVKAERGLERRRMEAMAAFQAARAIRRWRQVATCRRLVSDRLNRLVCARERRLYHHYLHAWIRLARVRARVKALVTGRAHRRLRVSLKMWRQWLAGRQLQQQRIQDFVNRLQRKCRVESMIQWLAYVKHRRRVAVLLDRAVAFRLHQCIHRRWLRRVQARRSLGAKTAEALEALAKWKQHRDLQRWHGRALAWRLRRLYRRFVLRKFLTAWRDETLEATATRFHSSKLKKRMQQVIGLWRVITQRRAELRAIAADVCNARRRRYCESVWSAWADLVDRRRKTKRSIVHYELQLRFKWLLHWHDAAQASAQERDMLVEKAAVFHGFAIKRHALARWAAATRDGYRKRAVLLACMMKLRVAREQRVALAVLAAWHEAVEQLKSTRQFSCDRQSRRVQRVLDSWAAWIHHRKRRRELLRDAGIYRRTRLLSIVFFHWQNYALAWKDAETVTKPSAVQPLPPVSAIHGVKPEAAVDLDACDLAFRRPLSPQAKRYRAKKQPLLHDTMGVDQEDLVPPAPSLPDAAALSLEVKKRLLVLGKWKPAQKSFSEL